MKSQRSIIVTGSTASGKTALAHRMVDLLVQQGNRRSALINLDAFQFYRGFDKGTAKPSRDEILHYGYRLLDFLSPNENIDAEKFCLLADETRLDILRQGGMPIFVGGSGLYLRALLHGLDSLPSRDEGLRDLLRHWSVGYGWPQLHALLACVDPIRAAELHPNDRTRIERALEVFLLTGRPMSGQRTRSGELHSQARRFPCYVVRVELPDEVLKERIRLRTRMMLDSGWIEEVKGLISDFGNNIEHVHAMKALGYREIFEFLSTPGAGSEKRDALEEKIYTLTCQYAKRQRTWNARETADLVTDGQISDTELLKLLQNLD